MKSKREDDRPGFYLYVDDVLSDLDLSLCSWGAIGLWWWMLMHMHKSPKRGALLSSSGEKVGYKSYTKTIQNETDEKVRGYLAELEQHGVLSRLPDGTIINRRMYNQQCRKDAISQCRSAAVNARWSKEKLYKKKKDVDTKVVQSIGIVIEKEKYLDFVFLLPEEYKKLVERYGEDGARERIARLNDGIGSKGYKYKSHYHTILNWDRMDRQRGGVVNGEPATSKYDGIGEKLESINP
jgi:hypothetical protein